MIDDGKSSNFRLNGVHELKYYFSNEGPIGKYIAGYRFRNQQLEMAEVVAETIADSDCLIAEAGTGTGKTLSYLVPAMLSGGKVIVSTATKTLQDQLFFRDIPATRKALALPITTAVLKGRSNYICHYYYNRARANSQLWNDHDRLELDVIEKFMKVTENGDWSNFSEVPDSSTIWNDVTSTRDNCVGSECEYFDKCFVFKARKKAMEADLVVVNHHLFFADVMLKDDGLAELLPACDTVVFDEAHKIPKTATMFFGSSISTNQLISLLRDIKVECQASKMSIEKQFPVLNKLEKLVKYIINSYHNSSGRYSFSSVFKNRIRRESIAKLVDSIQELKELLEQTKKQTEVFENCFDRIDIYLKQISSWQSEDNEDYVKWVEVFSKTIRFNASPLSISEIFSNQIDSRNCSWIFTSATLSVNGNFEHFQREMGLQKCRTAIWDSPFEYQKQALLLIPQGLPNPNSELHTAAVIENAIPAIKSTKGGVFLLFTSLRAMNEASILLNESLGNLGLDYPVLCQGSASKSVLLDRFRNHGNAILLGSFSFWEGVDVRGDALSLVVIDRLPFSSPDDPILEARIKRIRKDGGNPFIQYQLPETVITLKQGAGRLIRDDDDRGTMMICDERLISKSYGKKILDSLPPMRRTREANALLNFYLSDSEIHRDEIPLAEDPK